MDRPRDSSTTERISGLYHRENFGLIGIDWQAGTIQIALKGLEGQDVATLKLALADPGR